MIRYNGTGYKCDCSEKFSPTSFPSLLLVDQGTYFDQKQPNSKHIWQYNAIQRRSKSTAAAYAFIIAKQF